MTRVPWNKGLKTGIKPVNYIEISKEELIEHVKQGLNTTKIGEQLGVSRDVILNRLHEYGLWDMYEKHAIRWESPYDIVNDGLSCNGDYGCGFHCSFEDAKKEFFYSSTKDELKRSAYSALCRPCHSKRSSELYIIRKLKEDPDYVGESMLFKSDTHKECKTCRDIKQRSEYTIAGHNTDGQSSHCRDCTSKQSWDDYRKDMITTKYKQYSSIMRSEGNDCDLTLEEFKERWPKDNRCSVRRDIIMDFYPAEDKELWNKGGRHWPCAPSIDHFYPDKEMSKDNFWVISWRANETKSDMLGVEIEALYHAYMQKKGKVYAGEDALVLVKLEQDLETMKDYVGKYPDKNLESIKRHRKL